LDDELKKLSTMYIVSQEENNEDLSLEVWWNHVRSREISRSLVRT
jgi:hypothetical protein